MMEKSSSFLEKIITLLSWNNGVDPYRQRFIKLFNLNHSHTKVLEDRSEMEKTGEYITNQDIFGGDAASKQMVMPLVK